MSENLSAKYHQENKEILERKCLRNVSKSFYRRKTKITIWS